MEERESGGGGGAYNDRFVQDEEESNAGGIRMREESSAVTAVQNHSDMLFDAAATASEGHLMHRYRARLGPIFEAVLRNVHHRFTVGYKVREREKERTKK
jgi:hypothetical protein